MACFFYGNGEHLSAQIILVSKVKWWSIWSLEVKEPGSIPRSWGTDGKWEIKQTVKYNANGATGIASNTASLTYMGMQNYHRYDFMHHLNRISRLQKSKKNIVTQEPCQLISNVWMKHDMWCLRVRRYDNLMCSAVWSVLNILKTLSYNVQRQKTDQHPRFQLIAFMFDICHKKKGTRRYGLLFFICNYCALMFVNHKGTIKIGVGYPHDQRKN